MPFRTRTLALATLPLLTGTILLSGCGKTEGDVSSGASETIQVGKMTAAASAPMAPPVEGDSLGASGETETPPRPMPRKIIYTAILEVNTTDFKNAVAHLTQAVKANGGYVAETNVSGAAGELKNGTWKIRIPATRYEAFLAAAGGIGEVANSSSTSEDVSEEFYDIQARLKNKRVEEARLVRHLQVSTGKLAEILTVEREISRVREEIEQMQGRMRFLSHQSDFTTVTINLHELASLRRKPDAPSFGTQITRALVDSLRGIGAFTKAVVLALAYLLPWLVIAAGIGIPLGYLLRKRKAR